MSVTSGFFNSINGDRKYNAEQMSAIFNGIINDGILANIGTAFSVKANVGINVNIGIGRAWFNSTWLYNDTILPMTMDDSELVLDRIDAIVIEIDRSDAVRNGDIKKVNGTPSSSPQRPTMVHTNYVNQYPLAYIYRKAGSTEITQADITSVIGTSSTPYVTGILQVQNIDNIVAQWSAQWIQWYAETTNLGDAEMQRMLTEWQEWFNNQTTSSETQISQWMVQMQNDIMSWFNDLQVILDGDVAVALSNRILELESSFETLAKEKSIYMTIEDSSGNPIENSYGSEIEGRVVFSASSGGGVSDKDVNRIESELLTHVNNHDIHISSEEKAEWTQKIDGKAGKSTSVTSTLSASGWTGEEAPFSITLSVSGVTETSNQEILPTVDITTEQLTAYQNANIQDGGQATGSITLKAFGEKPEIDIPIRIMLRGD